MVEVDFSDDTYVEYLQALESHQEILGRLCVLMVHLEILTKNTYLLIFIKVPFFPCFRPCSAQATLMLLHQPLAMMPQGMYIKVVV